MLHLLRIAVLTAAGALALSGCAVGLTGTPQVVGEASVRLTGTVTTTEGGAVTYWWRISGDTEGRTETPHRTVNLEAGEYRNVSEVFERVDVGLRHQAALCAVDADERINCGRPRDFGISSGPPCAQVITKDTVLTQDLNCLGFSGAAITVAADNVTLDLNGHTVNVTDRGGTGSYLAIESTGNGVTIKNGAVKFLGGSYDSGTSIHVRGSNVTLTDLRVQGGDFILNGSDNRVLDTVMGTYYGTALTLTGDRNRIARSQFESGDYYAFMLDGSDNRLVDSTAVSYSGSEVSGDHWLIRGTSIRATRGNGLTLSGSNHRMVGSTIGGGIYGSAALDLSTSNAIVRDSTIRAFLGNGIYLRGSSRSRIVNNAVTGGSHGDAIHVSGDSAGTLLETNTAGGAEDDGIDVRNSDTRLRQNVAADNGDLGIEAVAGVVDLGGNTASGNGNPLQCVNVFCQ